MKPLWYIPRFGHGIQGQLWIIFVSLVTIPTISLGFFSYREVSSTERRQLEEKLTLTANDWRQIAGAYQEQIDKVFKREDALIKQKLIAINSEISSELDLFHNSSASFPHNPDNSLFKHISQITIGRSGSAFIIDRQGRYVVSRDHAYDGDLFTDHLVSSDRDTFTNVLTNIDQIKSAGTYEFRNKFVEKVGGQPRQQLTILSYYQPWNVIVGVTSYYTDFQSSDYEKTLQQDVRRKIAEQVVGTHGNLWVINSQGDYVVSRKHLQDGENILDTKDRDRPIVQEIIARAKKLDKGDSFIQKYNWKELGEKAPIARLTAITYLPEWDWIIGASAYYSDYQANLQHLQGLIGLICFVFILISSIGAYFFSLHLTRPIIRLTHLAERVSKNNFDLSVDQDLVKMKGEIGSLSNSFNLMIIALNAKISELARANANISKSQKQLEERADELGRMNKLMIGRELKMIELKDKLEKLESK
jgi:HAMP domain-containing protein